MGGHFAHDPVHSDKDQRYKTRGSDLSILEQDISQGTGPEGCFGFQSSFLLGSGGLPE